MLKRLIILSSLAPEERSRMILARPLVLITSP